MNIINKTKRLFLGLALSSLLLAGTGTGIAYGKDARSAAVIADQGKKTPVTQVAQKPACEGQKCKALHAKGLCSSVSVFCSACEHVSQPQKH